MEQRELQEVRRLMRQCEAFSTRLGEMAFESSDMGTVAHLYDLSQILDSFVHRADLLFEPVKWTIEFRRGDGEWIDFCGEMFTYTKAQDQVRRYERQFPGMEFKMVENC